MDKNIVVLGSTNIDHVMMVERLPNAGETLASSSYKVIPGGKGANQAVACVRLGAQTSFISCVSSLDAGAKLVAEFENDGMDISEIDMLDDVNTGVALIMVDNKGENIIGINPGANDALSTEKVGRCENSIAKADYLLMQLEVPIESVTLAAQLAKKHGTNVVLNPAPARELPADLLSDIDIITPNQTEARVLTGIDVIDTATAESAATILHAQGIATVIITMGKLGAYVSSEGHAQLVPGNSVDTVDTTAAGDTFNGALLVGLSSGQDLISACQFANKCAAFSVTRIGAQSSIPYSSDVTALL